MADKLLRFNEVEDKVGLKKTKIYQLISQGRFPAGIKIDGYAARWSQSQLDEWIAEQIQQQTQAKA